MTARWHRWLVRPTTREACTLLLVLLLAAGVGYAALRDGDAEPVSSSASTEAVTTASAQVTTLATLDFRRLDVQLSALRARAASGYRDDFEGVMDDFASEVEDSRITSQGSHTEAGLIDVGHDEATVLVATEARFRMADSDEKDKRTYAFLVSVTRVDDQWFVSDMEQLS